MTPRDHEVMRVISSGMGQTKAAKVLGISQVTIKHHLARIKAVCEVETTLKLALYWNCELFQIGLKELGL